MFPSHDLGRSDASKVSPPEAPKVRPEIPPKPKKEEMKSSQPKEEVEPIDLKKKTTLVVQAFVCNKCHKEFKTEHGLGQHMNDVHVEKKEALITKAPSFAVKEISHHMIKLVKIEGQTETFVSSGYVAWCGIVCNKHAYDQATHFKVGDKVIAKTKIHYSNVMNKDIVICARFDGAPSPLPKKRFALPAINDKVALVNQKGGVNIGTVMSMDEGPQGSQVRATYSSEPGDCGGPLINTNSYVVGFHFSAGKPNVDNLFAGVDSTFLGLVPKN